MTAVVIVTACGGDAVRFRALKAKIDAKTASEQAAAAEKDRAEYGQTSRRLAECDIERGQHMKAIYRFLFALVTGVVLAVGSASAATFGPPTFQPQAVQNGQLVRLAANIYQTSCNGGGENGRQYYLYEYVDGNRRVRTDVPAYRVIAPPDYGHAIGNRDWSSWQQAIAYACGSEAGTGTGTGSTGGATNTNPSNISGTWRFTTTGTTAANSCLWGPNNTPWQTVFRLAQAADGGVSGSADTGPLQTKLEFAAPGTWGVAPTFTNRYSPPTVTLLLHPIGWVSVLQLSGTLRGNTISGGLHHYSNDDCTFQMTR
jgi:hypothetical protein